MVFALCYNCSSNPNNQIMKLDTNITTIKGEQYAMSFPSEFDIEQVKKEKGIEQVTIGDLPRESVRNVILNSITGYKVQDKKEVFMLQIIAQWVLADGADDLPSNLFDLLTTKVLPAAVSQMGEENGKQVEKGIYSHWVMAQVYTVLGVTAE